MHVFPPSVQAPVQVPPGQAPHATLTPDGTLRKELQYPRQHEASDGHDDEEDASVFCAMPLQTPGERQGEK